jgi:hypothetical protein
MNNRPQIAPAQAAAVIALGKNNAHGLSSLDEGYRLEQDKNRDSMSLRA